MFLENISTINRNVGALLEASREDGLEETQRKLSIWLCLITRMNDKIIIYGFVRNTVKMWQSSSIWELHQHINRVFTNKLREYYIWEMLATVKFRAFLPVSSLQT
jgi:hypothetical protein